MLNVNIHHRGKTYPGGYWGPRTSTLDWCEPNYKHSIYIAEWANTQTNLGMLAFAVLGGYLAVSENLPTRYLVANYAFALVAIGSYAFHGTLLYEMQLADELPMLFSSSVNIFNLFDTSPGFESFNQSLAAGLVIANIVFAGTYSTIWRHPLYHQFVFAIAMITLPARTRYLLNSPRGAALSATQRSQVIRLNIAGAVLFAAAFAIWNVDNIFCEIWDHYKYIIGWPTAFLLEGHSWWHIGVGLGTYYLLAANTLLTLCIKDVPAKYEVRTFLGLPYVGRVGGAKAKVEWYVMRVMFLDLADRADTVAACWPWSLTAATKEATWIMFVSMYSDFSVDMERMKHILNIHGRVIEQLAPCFWTHDVSLNRRALKSKN